MLQRFLSDAACTSARAAAGTERSRQWRRARALCRRPKRCSASSTVPAARSTRARGQARASSMGRGRGAARSYTHGAACALSLTPSCVARREQDAPAAHNPPGGVSVAVPHGASPLNLLSVGSEGETPPPTHDLGRAPHPRLVLCLLVDPSEGRVRAQLAKGSAECLAVAAPPKPLYQAAMHGKGGGDAVPATRHLEAQRARVELSRRLQPRCVRRSAPVLACPLPHAAPQRDQPKSTCEADCVGSLPLGPRRGDGEGARRGRGGAQG